VINRRHRATATLYLAGDLLATVAAYLTAWVLRFEAELVPLTKTVPEFDRYLQLLPAVLVLWPVVFYFHGLYQVRRGRSRVDEALTIAMATLVATLLLSGFTTWYRPPAEPGTDSLEYFTYSRAFLALFALAGVVLVVAGRLALRGGMRRLHGQNPQRILVIGAGQVGREITGKLPPAKSWDWLPGTPNTRSGRSPVELCCWSSGSSSTRSDGPDTRLIHTPRRP
jgi:FlaA1/EpsC-like NDP-sugar epimerase